MANHRMVKAETNRVHTIKFIAEYSITVILYRAIKAENNSQFSFYRMCVLAYKLHTLVV